MMRARAGASRSKITNPRSSACAGVNAKVNSAAFTAGMLGGSTSRFGTTFARTRCADRHEAVRFAVNTVGAAAVATCPPSTAVTRTAPTVSTRLIAAQ